MVFDSPMFHILALVLDFGRCKAHPFYVRLELRLCRMSDVLVLYVLIWDFGGGWRFLTGV